MSDIRTHFPWLFGKPAKPRIEVDKYGVDIVTGPKVTRFMWSEVARIEIFKADLITFDEVVFAFQLKNPDRVVQLSEDIEGYDKLVSYLETQWPKIAPDWRSKVILPPFAECRTTVYTGVP